VRRIVASTVGSVLGFFDVPFSTITIAVEAASKKAQKGLFDLAFLLHQPFSELLCVSPPFGALELAADWALR